MRIYKHFKPDRDFVLHHGDCGNFFKEIPSNTIDLTVTSPPYCMGKDYDKSTKVQDFIDIHHEIVKEILRVTKPGGSICWQVGYHVKNSVLIPLDCLIYNMFSKEENIYLRNRIIWKFGHGLHAKERFSGRHETILWFTKGMEYYFDLDSIRVPQKYPGKRYYKGIKKGQYSGNPKGKNPSDVWEIPNVKANHIEKTKHPCQFPVALVQRLIRALCPPDGRIFDPYIGSGTTGATAILENRKFVGCERSKKYYEIAKKRCLETIDGNLRYRPIEKPLFKPMPTMSVAIKPSFFI